MKKNPQYYSEFFLVFGPKALKGMEKERTKR
jgi:hypothetical protein